MTITRGREFIQGVFGEVPGGFPGVLTRIGPDPLPDPGLYLILFKMFASPQHRVRRDVLRQHGGPTTATQIRIIHRLDPVLVHKNVLERLQSASEAEDANAALALIRNTALSATEDAIRQAIENLGDKIDLATFLNRWLAKMDRPPARPLVPENDPEVAVMTSGEAMASLGRRFRNCATTRVVYAAVGFEVLLEWKPSPGLVAQCHRLTDGGWVLTDIHAKANGRVDPVTAAAFRSKLASCGIPALSPGSMHPRTSGILSLLGVGHGGLGANLGFEDDNDLDELGSDLEASRRFAKANASERGEARGHPVFRRVGLDQDCPRWIAELVRREYRKRLHPDAKPSHLKDEATSRFLEMERTFGEIWKMRGF